MRFCCWKTLSFSARHFYKFIQLGVVRRLHLFSFLLCNALIRAISIFLLISLKYREAIKSVSQFETIRLKPGKGTKIFVAAIVSEIYFNKTKKKLNILHI